MGGAADYTDRPGGYEHRLGRHIGLGITPGQRLRLTERLGPRSHPGAVRPRGYISFVRQPSASPSPKPFPFLPPPAARE